MNEDMVAVLTEGVNAIDEALKGAGLSDYYHDLLWDWSCKAVDAIAKAQGQPT